MSDYIPQPNEVRADFITLHTRNFDAYQLGRSLTSEQEVYGDAFDRMIASVERAAAARSLEDAADDHDQALGGETYGGAYLRARAEAYREGKSDGES